MLLRRITEHVKAQNWTAVALDFVIVVVGVFIGIQVSNWNEAQVNRVIGEGYAARLKADLEVEAATWGALQAYYQIASGHASGALEGFRQDAATLEQQFLIDLYQASQRTNAPLIRGTFDELLSTGRIESVANAETRRILSNHYGRQGATQITQNERAEYRRVIREQMDARVQDAIRASCGDRYIRDEQNFNYLVLPEHCDIDLPDELVKREILRLHANEEIQQNLRFQKSVLDGRLGSLGNVIDSSQSTLAALEKASP